MKKPYHSFVIIFFLLSGCAGSPEITKSDFSFSQKVVVEEISGIYNYDKLIEMQERKFPLPKRMAGRQGNDFLLEYKLYMQKYLLLENTEIRVKKKDNDLSTIEIYSYRIGFFDKKRDKNTELYRMEEIKGKLSEIPSNKAN